MAGIGIGATVVPQLTRWVIERMAGDRLCRARRDHVRRGVSGGHVVRPRTGEWPAATGRDRGLVAGVTAGQSLRTSAFWLLTVAVFLVVTTVNGMIAHLVPLLTDRGIDVGRATSVLSAVGLSVIVGRLVAGYLLDRFFAPYVAAGLFVTPLVAIGLLMAGAGGVAPVVAAVSLGFGLGSEVDVVGFLVGRYFGLRSFGEIYGYVFAIFTLGTGFGPVLAVSFDADALLT